MIEDIDAHAFAERLRLKPDEIWFIALQSRLRRDSDLMIDPGKGNDDAAPPAPLGLRALILVVERDPHVRRLERYFLEESGFTVEFADDGLQAIELARKLRPAIIIAEILVPKCDGLTVCRTLKSDPSTRNVIVLILSILAAEDRARDAGADGFLRKPLNDALLVDAVRKLLGPIFAEGPTHGSR